MDGCRYSNPKATNGNSTTRLDYSFTGGVGVGR